jgi:hypothetical protein
MCIPVLGMVIPEGSFVGRTSVDEAARPSQFAVMECGLRFPQGSGFAWYKLWRMVGREAGAAMHIDLRIRDAAVEDMARVQAIFAHHVRYGMACLEEMPPYSKKC